jgi:hypothetical protein
VGSFAFFRQQTAERQQVGDRQSLTCVVTIHGIGFQQARDGKRIGYADQFHGHLKEKTGPGIIGDDPEKPGYPIYVVGGGAADPGLDRLERPLTDGGASVAHVALVYSDLEMKGFDMRSSLKALDEAAAHLFRYCGLFTLLVLGVKDLAGIFRRGGRVPPTRRPSLRVRRQKIGRGLAGRIPLRATPDRDAASGVLLVIQQLADDVCAYVKRPRMRASVRDFASSAIERLAARQDVASIVVNSHSQGTVLAFDVLRILPPAATDKIHWLITAGSPLRKYVDFFAWPGAIGSIRAPWTNFWDERDPVGDPLAPRKAWRPGTESSTLISQAGLLSRSGSGHPIDLVDRRVDNLTNSPPGSLRAHNYWDNVEEFVTPVAQTLKGLANAGHGARLLVGPAGGVVLEDR